MAMWRPSGSGNLSNRRPMSSAAMNNNPQGVQQVMQPVAAPMSPRPFAPSPVATNPLPPANPGYGPPATTGGGPPTGNPPGSNVPAVRPPGPPAVRPVSPYIPNIGVTVSPLPSRGMADRFAQTPYGMSVMPGAYPPAGAVSPLPVPKMNASPMADAVNPAIPAPVSLSPSAPATSSRIPMSDAEMPGMESMVGRWRQRQDDFNGIRMQGRLDTSMARNVMAGQPEEGSPSFGRPMNVPGATQTFGGKVVSPPQRYGQEGVIPGAFRGMTPAEGDLHGLSPDAFRVATGGQPMIPYVPSGTPATDGRTARQTTIANRNARARGVRGSGVAEWRATSPSSLIPQMNREQQQQQVATDQSAPSSRNDNYAEWSGQAGLENQAQAPVSLVTQATQAPVSPVAQANQAPVNPFAPATVNAQSAIAQWEARRPRGGATVTAGGLRSAAQRFAAWRGRSTN